mgnify:CR=1 FL=1
MTHSDGCSCQVSFGPTNPSVADVLAEAERAAGGRACHAVGEGAKNKVGPVLNGLDGRKSGTVEGYNYSDANKNSGITWSKQTFLDYIKDPKAKMPGTKMVFNGVKQAPQLADLVAYLKQATQ